MKLAQDFWLGSVAAQRNAMSMVNYTTAFCGTATLQAWQLGINAPVSFWSAVARVGAAPEEAAVEPGPRVAEAEIPVPASEAAAAEPEPALETAPTPVTVPDGPVFLTAPRDGVGDDLKAISGIGAKLEALLNGLGIYHYDQIATLDADTLDWLDTRSLRFRSRAERYDFKGQAGVLSGV